MTRMTKLSCMVLVVSGGLVATGCDEKSLDQAMRGLGFVTAQAADDSSLRPAAAPTRGGDASPIPIQGSTNANTNANDNMDDNGNDNTGNTNGNDNTGNTNTNTNTNDNTGNGNTNTNTNDNTSGGLCPDGSTRLEGEIDSPVELEAEYRLSAAGCERFRVEVENYAAGTYDIVVNGMLVGTIQVGGDGRGEQEFDTEDGDFPADFPLMAIGDVVQVGAHSVTMGNDCSSDDVDSCTGNTNTNTNTNSNDNTDDNGNTNTNSNDNFDDNSNDNVGNVNDNR